METTTTTCSGCWDESCADCNPEAKTEANGWHGEPSKIHGQGNPFKNGASQKQIDFIRRLWAEKMPADVQDKVDETIAQLTKSKASDLIDGLIKMRSLAEPQPSKTGASDKQADFIRTLGREAGLTDEQIEAKLSRIADRKMASMAIDDLKLDIANNRMLARSQGRQTAPQASELEDAIYKIDGEVRKVYHTQSGQQVAKVWDEDSRSFEYVGKRGLKGLTPEYRMTLEEAKAFGAVYGICCNCSRTLTDEVSIEAGIGPVCASRFA